MRALKLGRSLLFMGIFYGVTALFLILGLPLLLASRALARQGLIAHAHTCQALFAGLVGARLQVRGLDKLPAGPVLIAAKHQSAWDTFGLLIALPKACLVMKSELMWIPIYGAFARKFGMISVDRDQGPSALRGMLKEARARLSEGYSVLIFPEGTRTTSGAAADYKSGVLLLYDALQVPCVPVALNTGLFWPKGSAQRSGGRMVVEILEPIPAGLPRREFKARLVNAIETAVTHLEAEAGLEPIDQKLRSKEELKKNNA